MKKDQKNSIRAGGWWEAERERAREEKKKTEKNCQRERKRGDNWGKRGNKGKFKEAYQNSMGGTEKEGDLGKDSSPQQKKCRVRKKGKMWGRQGWRKRT